MAVQFHEQDTRDGVPYPGFAPLRKPIPAGFAASVSLGRQIIPPAAGGERIEDAVYDDPVIKTGTTGCRFGREEWDKKHPFPISKV